MATELITVRNTLNGKIATVRPNIMDNPTISKYLVVVEDENPKPMNLATPTTAEEFIARRSGVIRGESDNLTTEDFTETEEG